MCVGRRRVKQRVLAAGLDGADNKRDPGKRLDINMYTDGHKAKGAESWFAIGSFRVQPSEYMKIGIVLMLAKFFHDDYRANDPGYGFLRLWRPVALFLVPAVLVLSQPDLGSTMMIFFTSLTVILFARVRWWVIVGMVVGVLAT